MRAYLRDLAATGLLSLSTALGKREPIALYWPPTAPWPKKKKRAGLHCSVFRRILSFSAFSPTRVTQSRQLCEAADAVVLPFDLASSALSPPRATRSQSPPTARNPYRSTPVTTFA
jgi:hypothetical protein